MDKLLIYSFKSAISLAVLYFFYRIFLGKSTHFRLNRFVIVFSVIISIVLPPLANLFRLPIPDTLNFTISFPVSGNAVSESTPIGEISVQNKLSLIEIIGLIYVGGAVIILARLAYQAIYLHAVARLSKTSYIRGFKIISLDTDMVPFSYFKRIFIPAGRFNENSMESVILHEKTHLSQGHYMDLFVIQVITLLQWFNPFIWLFEKSLKEVHEFLADEAVLQTGNDMGNYQAILVNEAMGGPVFILTNQFNKSIIKKRILMMKKVKSPKIAQLKALLIVPLLAGLLMAFANPSLISQTVNNEVTIKGNVSDRFTGKPVAGANIIIKDKMVGTITDLEGNYQIIINSSDNKLVFTFTGYRTQEITIGKNSIINVQLEPDILAIDFNNSNSFVPIEKKEDQNESKPDKKDAKPEFDEGFIFVEELPAYPGGTEALQKFIQSNLQYPAEAKNAGLEGTVMVIYTINEKGEVTNAKVIRGVRMDIDKEALRVTNLIKGWKPAMHGGRPVSATVTMPIEFKLK